MKLTGKVNLPVLAENPIRSEASPNGLRIARLRCCGKQRMGGSCWLLRKVLPQFGELETDRGGFRAGREQKPASNSRELARTIYPVCGKRIPEIEGNVRQCEQLVETARGLVRCLPSVVCGLPEVVVMQTTQHGARCDFAASGRPL